MTEAEYSYSNGKGYIRIPLSLEDSYRRFFQYYSATIQIPVVSDIFMDQDVLRIKLACTEREIKGLTNFINKGYGAL